MRTLYVDTLNEKKSQTIRGVVYLFYVEYQRIYIITLVRTQFSKKYPTLAGK